MKTQLIKFICILAILLVPNYIDGQNNNQSDKVRVVYTYDSAGNRIKRVVTTTQSGSTGNNLGHFVLDSALVGKTILPPDNTGGKIPGGKAGKGSGGNTGSNDRNFSGSDKEISLP